MAVFTRINKSDLKKIQGFFNLGKVKNWKGIKKGIENTNYYIEFERKKTVLKAEFIANQIFYRDD